MSYTDLLRQYGSQQESAEHRIYIYAQDPRKLTTPEQVAYRDRDAAGTIATLERYIADLKDYRQALAARYGELVTLPYTDRLKLERVPHWKGHIEYVVTITRQLSDGTETHELREVFPGKERHKAFARFEELKKQRPGIASEQETERRAWER